jgi:cysteine desulfurase family protein (TIGR01976 family)
VDCQACLVVSVAIPGTDLAVWACAPLGNAELSGDEVWSIHAARGGRPRDQGGGPPWLGATFLRMTYDVKRIRAQYPALSGRTVYLDGAAGTQSPEEVIEAIAGAYRIGTSNAGGQFETSARADGYTRAAREAVADLVNGDAGGVVLGPNMTTLTYRFARTLADTWNEGDNVVVSRLDHDANIRPWVQLAGRTGVEVRWAEADLDTGELPAEQYDRLVDDRTRLVALTAASNILGTRPDVRAVTDLARERGAISYVDGVHSTAHGLTDIRAYGSDLYATSAYKWAGPHVGCVIADPGLLAPLRPEKLASSSDGVPDRFEWGTPSYPNFAGVTAAVDHLAGLDDEATGTRRERLVRSLTASEDHEQRLLADLLAALAADERITVYGRAAERTSTVYFTVAGLTPNQVAVALAADGVNVWDGHNYAWEITAALGIRDKGGAVRVSLDHYTDTDDVARLLEALAKLD